MRRKKKKKDTNKGDATPFMKKSSKVQDTEVRTNTTSPLLTFNRTTRITEKETTNLNLEANLQGPN